MKFDIIVIVLFMALVYVVFWIENPIINVFAMCLFFFGLMAAGENEKIQKNSRIIRLIGKIFKD